MTAVKSDEMFATTICLVLEGQLPILSVADSIEALLGFPPDDYLSARVSLKQQIHPHDTDIADILFSSGDPGTSGTFNIRLRHANGRIRCIRGEYSKESGPEGVVLKLLLQDAKSLQRTMSDASTTVNFTAMMENTDDYVYFKDRNHVFTGASQTLVSLCDPAEHWTDLLGQTDYDVFPEEYADVYYRLEKQVFAGIPVAREVQEYVSKDGRKGWVDNRKYPIRNEHGEIIGLYGIARDISEQKRAEQALRTSELKFRTLFESMAEGVALHELIVDKAGTPTNYRVIDVNPAYESILGIPRQEAVGSLGSDLYQSPAAPYLSQFAQVVQTRLPLKFESIFEPMGKTFAVSVTCPGPQRFVTIFEDITQRRRVEAELRLQALVLDQIQDHVTVTDLDGVVTYVNQAQKQVLQSDHTGQHLTSFGDGPAADATQAEIAAATLKEGHWEGVVVNPLANGGHILVNLRTTLVRDKDGQPVAMVGVGTDITERKQAEAALQHRQAMLARTEGIAHVGSWEWDVATDTTMWSDELFRIFQRDPAEGAPSFAEHPALYFPEDMQRLKDAVNAALNQGMPYELELRAIRRDGTTRICLARGHVEMDVDKRVTRLFGSLQDITERKQAEKDIFNLAERYRLANKATNDVIWDWDVIQDSQRWNEAGTAVFGWTEIVQGPVSAHWWVERVHPDDAERVHESFFRVLNNPELDVWHDEYRFRKADGAYADVTDCGYVLRDGDGKALRMIGAMQDITERKRTEAELEQHRHHLEKLVLERTHELEAARMAAEAASHAKSTFLANMSHELRTPMNGVMGMVDMALRRATDPQQIDWLNKSRSSAQHLLAVINDILDLSKIEADRLTLESIHFKFGEVLDNLISLLGHKAQEKQIELLVDLAPEVPRMAFLGDPLRLGQILLNLTGNALKFTDRGSITVRARLLEDHPEDVLMRIEVTDTGIGISAEQQQRLFTAFEQADGSMTRKYGGTGLGLVITKRLVQLMGGEIVVTSTLGQGSTFWFTVRLGKSTDAVPPAPTFTRKSADERLIDEYAGTRILLAEDEPINQEVSRGLLEDAGLIVDLAEDGLQAVALAKQNTYALILMDMQMPNLNGIDATQAIRADSLNRHTPILAMTANAFDEDRQICIDAGMNDHIGKPVDPDKLHETLLGWLERRGD